MIPRPGRWLALAVLVIGAAAATATYINAALGVMRYDSEQTKNAVLAKVPIGSAIARAESEMTAAGLRCGRSRSERFGGGQSFAGILPTSDSRADFLWCDSGDRATWSFITKRWQIIFVDTECSVSGLQVSVDLTGP